MPAGRLSPTPSRTYIREWKAVGFSARDCCHLNRETLFLDCAIAGMSGADPSVAAFAAKQNPLTSRTRDLPTNSTGRGILQPRFPVPHSDCLRAIQF